MDNKTLFQQQEPHQNTQQINKQEQKSIHQNTQQNNKHQQFQTNHQQGKIQNKKHSRAQSRIHTLPNPQSLVQLYTHRPKSRASSTNKNQFNKQQNTNKSNQRQKHERSRSYQDHRTNLQKQLYRLTIKKQKLDQLRQHKNKLKVKLDKLQYQLKQLKNHNQQKNNHMKSKQSENPFQHKHPKFNTYKNIKRAKLKPLHSKNSMHEQEMKYTRKSQEKSQGEEEVVNYYYEAQLHHKCLNCKHFHTKIQDVRIPKEIAQDFNA